MGFVYNYVYNVHNRFTSKTKTLKASRVICLKPWIFWENCKKSNKILRCTGLKILPSTQSCQPVTLKKSIIQLKILRWKKVFLRAERASRAQSAKSFWPGSRARLRALEAHGFRCSLGAILALFLNIFIQKLWPIFHNINNVCKFQNFHSPVKKKKNNNNNNKKKKKWNFKKKMYFIK